MAGIHQIDNCALAVEALDRLADLGFPVKEEKLKAGLLRAKWPGRFEIIGRETAVYRRRAHNEDGAVKLAQSIRFYFTNRRIIYIMGILKDKEVDKIILNTCDYADAIITVAAPGNPRAMSSCELAEVVRRVHENADRGGQSGGGRGNGTPSGRERGCYHRFGPCPFWGISSESRKRGSSEKSGSGRSGETQHGR